MQKLSKYLVPLSFIVLILSFWNRNTFSNNIAFNPGINNPPHQQQITKAPFSVTMDEQTYKVQPLYEYDLVGLVVSYQHHDGDSMLHAAWNDHLNMMDVCVIWQDSALSPYLNKLTFWNGQFTCNVKTRDSQAWSSFHMDQLSNNHLISDDSFIRKQVKKIKIGDQIRIKGWLSTYQYPGGGKRGTSTTRSDTGNGACETIYIADFNIISSMNNGWRMAMWASLGVLILSLLGYFLSPYSRD